MRGLYAITPATLDSKRLIEQVSRVIAGGASVVQYRAKQLAKDIAKTQAQALRAVTRATGTTFIINDDSELAMAVGADGVHLGRDDGGVDVIPRLREMCAARLPHRPFIIGVSCYNELSRGAAAVASGADYIAFGSFFSSPTKPHAARADLALIHAAKARFKVPVVAIGGITVENAPQLIAANVDAVAVISSLFDADDVEQRAREFTHLFKPENHVELHQ